MNKKIIVAIDLSNLNKAIRLAKKIKNEVYAFKIGHEFFYNFGIDGYKKLYKICPRIFLDLKLHDIPNTVAKGLTAISKLKPMKNCLKKKTLNYTLKLEKYFIKN